jgi:hypothetical protein
MNRLKAELVSDIQKSFYEAPLLRPLHNFVTYTEKTSVCAILSSFRSRRISDVKVFM